MVSRMTQCNVVDFYHARIAKFCFKNYAVDFSFAKVLRQAQYKLFTQLWLVLSFAERSALANKKICSIRSKRLRVLRVKYRIICEKY